MLLILSRFGNALQERTLAAALSETEASDGAEPLEPLSPCHATPSDSPSPAADKTRAASLPPVSKIAPGFFLDDLRQRLGRPRRTGEQDAPIPPSPGRSMALDATELTASLAARLSASPALYQNRCDHDKSEDNKKERTGLAMVRVEETIRA